MKINTNLLNSSIDNLSTRDRSEPTSALERLSQHKISGEEVVGMLQQYGLLSQLQRELMIDTELESIECTPEEIFSAYKAFYHQQQINSDEDRSIWLQQNNFTLAQFEQLVLRTIKLDRFKQENFGSKVDSYFLQRKSQNEKTPPPLQVNVTAILFDRVKSYRFTKIYAFVYSGNLRVYSVNSSLLPNTPARKSN